MPTILIVEDSPSIRQLLHTLLTWAGYTTLFAADGASALERTELESPDMVLMDLDLPVLNGWEATRLLKATPRLRHIPVIVVSARAFPEERQAAFAVGCDAYEPKPIDIHKLLATLQALQPVA
ncbi:MAG: response regulator [Roseiflexaceae bacterium]